MNIKDLHSKEKQDLGKNGFIIIIENKFLLVEWYIVKRKEL